MPPSRKLTDDALRVEVLAACRELIAEGRYPSQHAITNKGVVARSDRILAARAGIADRLHMPAVMRRASAVQRQAKRRKLDPPRPRDDPPADGGPCWRERRAFWSTETGRRTRALLMEDR